MPASFHSDSPDEIALLTYLLENVVWAGALSDDRDALAQQMLSRLGVNVPGRIAPDTAPSDRPAP